MDVAIVTVGDELLAGETVNTNAAWLAEKLAARGVETTRITTIPDRIAEIERVVNEYQEAYDAVIVTGGLGPTHDDRTMAGIAATFDRDLEIDEKAVAWLEADGFANEELVSGTALLPSGARPIHNTAGVAPGCIIEDTYVLPGVPEEMKAMFDAIETEFSGPTRYTERVVCDEPESALVDRFETLRDRFSVTVGSYPERDGPVRVKISGTDEATVTEAAAWFAKGVRHSE